MFYHFHLNFSFSWDNFYDKNLNIDEEINNKAQKNYLKPAKGNTYINHCYFFDIHSPSQGGAIEYVLRNSNILIEQCSFIQCTSQSYQGAIRSVSNNSIIAFTCGQNCSSKVNDAFLGASTSSPDSIISSSISHCNAAMQYTMYHANGIVALKSVNFSYNSANYQSPLGCFPTKNNTEGICTLINYCSFFNNTAAFQCNINLRSQNMQHQIKNSNIIQNNATNTFSSKGKTTLYHCCIINNGNPCFYTEDEKSIIILQICHTDEIITTEMTRVSQTEGQNSFIHSLPFYMSGTCFNPVFSYECATNSFLRNLSLHKITFLPLTFFLLSK